MKNNYCNDEGHSLKPDDPCFPLEEKITMTRKGNLNVLAVYYEVE
jgi:hypothetical protein